MRPFKLLLTDGEHHGTVSMHMIGPKEIRLLKNMADTCSPPLAEPEPDVLKSMLKLGAVRMVEPEIDKPHGPLLILTDLGKYIVQLSVFQPSET